MSIAIKKLQGIHVMGQLMNDFVTWAPLIMMGKYDEELILALDGTGKGDGQTALVYLKDQIRDTIQRIVDKESEKIQAEQQAAAIANFKNMSRVSEQGTVAEIAQRLNISKSEVRRMRREGLI